MHRLYHNQFLESIHNKTKVKLTFYCHSDEFDKIRLCAPLDFGPKRKAKDQRDRYHFWDYESENGYHPLSVFAEDIVNVEFLPDIFDTKFVIWAPNWFIKRNWGVHS